MVARNPSISADVRSDPSVSRGPGTAVPRHLRSPASAGAESPEPPVLVVVVGRPGTGKTTLARLLATELRAAHLRLDAIQAAVLRSRVAQQSYGLVGYLVAEQVAASSLAVGTSVVVDAVCPIPNARQIWPRVAANTGSRLRVVEVTLSDAAEHQRRVESRVSDLEGVQVPTWAQVQAGRYQPWDTARDGPRLVLDNRAAAEATMGQIRRYLVSALPMPQPRRSAGSGRWTPRRR